MNRTRSKRVQTILAVVDHARTTKLPMHLAVEDYRALLRSAMRVWKKRESYRARNHDFQSRVVEHCARNRKRLRLESARVRRLQREFASWQEPTVVVDVETSARSSKLAAPEVRCAV